MDIRRLAFRQRVKLSFPLRNGMLCVVSEDGTARVPGLEGPPKFSLEEELASAAEFVLEPAGTSGKDASRRGRTALTRAQLIESFGSAATAEEAGHEED